MSTDHDELSDSIEEITELDEVIFSDAERFGDGYSESILEMPQVGCILDLYRAVQFPFLVLSPDLRIVWTNKHFSRVFGDRRETIGMPLFNYFQFPANWKHEQPVYKTLHSVDYGYSWKGRIETKDTESMTLIGNLIITPVMGGAAPANTGRPQEPFAYFVMLDDLTEENKAFVKSTFLSLLEASKLKDNDTGMHIQRVNEYSKLISGYLNEKQLFPEVDKEFIMNISFLAAMHDVGKIGTPDDILNKKGSLADWEWEIMKEHTINGAYILSTYPALMAREICLSHHEKWDGSGYPYHFTETMIPLSARIVTMADVYDALRMERSYKPAYPHEKASEIIENGSGTHFDPTIVDVFSSRSREFEEIFDSLID
jgi:HD-GYP domain-containing protein (c-di-GMP phosphodiesterase class II)